MKLRKNNLKKIVDEIVEAENVFKTKRERKYTVKDELQKLGSYVGVHYHTALKWYNNTGQPRLGNLYGISDFYEKPMSKIIYFL